MSLFCLGKGRELSGEAIYRQVARAFKRLLKERGVTYEELAQRLEVSERTVKRIMNGDDGSISRIAEACAAIGVKFFDLMEIAQEQEDESFQLSQEQESFLAASVEHHVIFRALVKGAMFHDLLESHNISKAKLRSLVKDLESMGLVERHPGDVVRTPYANRPQNFISDGPLQYTVGMRDMQKFADSLDRRRSKSRFASMSSGARMSMESIEAWIEDAERLAEKYCKISQREKAVLAEDKLIQMRWLLAIVYPFVSWIDEVRLGEGEYGSD